MRTRGLIIFGASVGVVASALVSACSPFRQPGLLGRALFHEPTARGVDSVVGELGVLANTADWSRST